MVDDLAPSSSNEYRQYGRHGFAFLEWVSLSYLPRIRNLTIAPSVFPGGFLPTLTFLIDTLTKGSQGRLVVDSVSNIGPHYSRTLREWRRRFEARFEDVIIPGMLLHSHSLAASLDF